MQSIALRSIKNVNVRGKRVLLRTSLNPAVDGNIADDRRLKVALPTLRLLSRGGAKIFIVGYFGREGRSLVPVFEALRALAPDVPMRFCGSLRDAECEASSLREGSALVLENTRRDPGEESNDPSYARELANLAELFVGDAFAEAHRNYASNVGVASLLPSYAGLLMEEEVRRLSGALSSPARPSLAIIGGTKFETKRLLIEKLLPLYDSLLIGGAIANDFLKARNVPIGDSVTSSALLSGVLADERIKIPEDMVAIDAEGNARETVCVAEGERIADIGERTAKRWAKMISQASFVLWNGPMGIYEDGFMRGTDALAHAIAESPCRAVIGGGDTDAALARYRFEKERVFVSTGGGAMLAFLSGEKLPGIEVLKT